MRALLKTARSVVFADNGLFLGVVLLLAVVASFTFLVDWGTAHDNLSASEKDRMESCVAAQRALGARFLEQRPDCTKYVLPPAAATTADQR